MYSLVHLNSAIVYLASAKKNLVLKIETIWSQSWHDPSLRLTSQVSGIEELPEA